MKRKEMVILNSVGMHLAGGDLSLKNVLFFVERLAELLAIVPNLRPCQ